MQTVLRLVERHPRDAQAAGSNPLAPNNETSWVTLQILQASSACWVLSFLRPFLGCSQGATTFTPFNFGLLERWCSKVLVTPGAWTPSRPMGQRALCGASGERNLYPLKVWATSDCQAR